MSHFFSNIKEHRLTIMLLIAGLVLMISALGLTQPVAAEQGSLPSPRVTATNNDCLGCHSQPGMTKLLANGEVMLLTIDESHFSETVHYQAGLSCTDCHLDITGFPHDRFAARSLREASMLLYPACQKCHVEQYNQTLDSIHQKLLAGGNFNAAICTDCHNPHIQTRITDHHREITANRTPAYPTNLRTLP
jgi:hypothetical protein